MFILGLIIGPLIGMIGGDYLVQTSLNAWSRAAVVALVLVFVVFAGFFQLELKIGLLIGLLLGLLLRASPVYAPGEDTSVDPEAAR